MKSRKDEVTSVETHRCTYTTDLHMKQLITNENKVSSAIFISHIYGTEDRIQTEI